MYLYLSIKSFLIRYFFSRNRTVQQFVNRTILIMKVIQTFAFMLKTRRKKDDFFLELNFPTNFYNFISSDLEIRRIFCDKVYVTLNQYLYSSSIRHSFYTPNDLTRTYQNYFFVSIYDMVE